MTLIVYVDMFFLENFIVDMFLLTVTAQSLNIKITKRRLFISSSVGALYSFTMLFNSTYFMTNIVFRIIVAWLIIYIGFGIKQISFILKATIIFIFYGFVLWGIFTYAEYKRSNINQLVIKDVHFSKQLLILMIIYIFVSRIVSLLIDKQKEKSYIYDVQVVSNNKTKKFKALLDTGNELKEPITDLPVMIVAENIFGEDDYDANKTFDIPYCSVGNSKSILKAFKPESIKVRIGGKYCCKLALIAIYSSRFAKDDEYQALLSRYMI